MVDRNTHVHNFGKSLWTAEGAEKRSTRCELDSIALSRDDFGAPFFCQIAQIRAIESGKFPLESAQSCTPRGSVPTLVN